MSRRGEQFRRFGELAFGFLTGDRQTLERALTGDEEALDQVADQGDAVMAEIGARVRRVANHDGSGRRRTVLNAGQPARLRVQAEAPVEAMAEVVDGDDVFARRATPARGHR